MEIYTNTDKDNILAEDLTSIVTEPADVAHMYRDMAQLCRGPRPGLGLAANQVGIRENFFFAAPGAKFEGKTVGHLCINPTWRPHPTGQEVEIFGEGCLSLPGELYAVKRWSTIFATWMNTQGHIRRDVKLRGQAAQVFQHEHDHLRGVTLRESGRRLQTPLEEAFAK